MGEGAGVTRPIIGRILGAILPLGAERYSERYAVA